MNLENTQLNENTHHDKIGEYVARIKNGETMESFGKIPPTWTRMIEERLHQEILNENKKDKVVIFSGEIQEDMKESVEKFKNEDTKIQDIEASTDLENENYVEEIKDELQVSKTLEKINNDVDVLQNETSVNIDAVVFEHKAYEWNDLDHKDATNMYNQLVDIANGASEGFKENAQNKINEYLSRILKGESKEKVLQGLSSSFVSQIEAQLSLKKEEKDGVKNLLELESIDEIKNKILSVGQNYYFFTHQTGEETAQNIFETNFEVSPGTGISSTTTFLNPESVINQIERQFEGDSHRSYQGMFILAIPKNVLDSFNQGKNKSEILEEMLLTSPEYGKNGNSKIVIPEEYNFGYIKNKILYSKNNF